MLRDQVNLAEKDHAETMRHLMTTEQHERQVEAEAFNSSQHVENLKQKTQFNSEKIAKMKYEIDEAENFARNQGYTLSK